MTIELSPQPDWQWEYCSSNEQLFLSLGDEMAFKAAIPSKKLIPDGKSTNPFTIVQTEDYYLWTEQLTSYQIWNKAQLAEIVFNGLANRYFHKPVMPKNWLFNASVNQVAKDFIQQGEICWLDSELGSACWLIIDANEQSCTCMLLDNEMVANGQRFDRFAVVKVTHAFICSEQQNKRRSFA